MQLGLSLSQSSSENTNQSPNTCRAFYHHSQKEDKQTTNIVLVSCQKRSNEKTETFHD